MWRRLNRLKDDYQIAIAWGMLVALLATPNPAKHGKASLQIPRLLSGHSSPLNCELMARRVALSNMRAAIIISRLVVNT